MPLVICSQEYLQFQAVWRDQIPAAEILLNSGTDVMIRNQEGKKAIELVRSVEMGALVQSYDTFEFGMQ